MTRKFHLETTLEEFPLPRALQNLHERGFTGRIIIRRGDITKVIFLIEGQPVNVDSTLRDETLGRFLVKKGRITDADFDRSIQLMMEQNIQQGAALVKLKCLSPKELYHEVKAQTREKLVSAFAWTNGFLGCYQEIEFVADLYRFEMPMPSVMREGIIRFFPPGAAEAQLARASGGPITVTPGFAERLDAFDLTQREHELLELVDGGRTVLELKTAMSSYPFAGKFLYLLFVAGLIGGGGRPEAALRDLGAADEALPAVEDFLMASADETAPEVVEEEVVEDHGEFSLEEDQRPEPNLDDLVTPDDHKTAEVVPPPWEAPPPGERPALMVDEDTGDEMMDEGDIFAEPKATVTMFDKPKAVDVAAPPDPGNAAKAGDAGETLALGGEDEEEKEKAPPREQPPLGSFEVGPPEAADAPEAEMEAMPGEDEEEEEKEKEGEAAPDEAGPQYRDESEILEAYMNIKGKDFYALLGIGPEAGDAEVEQAYHKLFDSWDWSHFSPDIDMEVMAKLEEIHTQIIRAYESLRTEKNRVAYRQKTKKDAAHEGIKDKLASEQCLKKGLECVRKRDWPRAQQMFEQAVAASPKEPEFKSYLGWSIYQNPTLDLASRREQAKKLLNEAVALNQQMDASHVFLGKIYKDEGKIKNAEDEFKAALRANPRCREADRELKAHAAGEW